MAALEVSTAGRLPEPVSAQQFPSSLVALAQPRTPARFKETSSMNHRAACGTRVAQQDRVVPERKGHRQVWRYHQHACVLEREPVNTPAR